MDREAYTESMSEPGFEPSDHVKRGKASSATDDGGRRAVISGEVISESHYHFVAFGSVGLNRNQGSERARA